MTEKHPARQKNLAGCHSINVKSIVYSSSDFSFNVVFYIAKHGDTLSVPPCSLVVVDGSAAYVSNLL